MSKAPTPKQTSKSATPLGSATPITQTLPPPPSSASANNNNNTDLPPLPPSAGSQQQTPTTANPPPPLPPGTSESSSNPQQQPTHVAGALLLPGETAPPGMQVGQGGEVVAGNSNNNNKDNNNNIVTQPKMGHPNDNNDDDDDDDSDASSDGYDFQTGEIVVRQEMSPRRKQQILDRAMQKREMDTTMRVDNYIKPLPPRRTAQSIRQRSRQIIDEAREVIALDIGLPPRVVRDEETGYILPRESVVTVAKPIEVEDETGNVTLVSAPTTGYGLSKQFDEIEKEKTKEKATVTHYARSVEALRYAQQQRLLRQLNVDNV